MEADELLFFLTYRENVEHTEKNSTHTKKQKTTFGGHTETLVSISFIPMNKIVRIMYLAFAYYQTCLTSLYLG